MLIPHGALILVIDGRHSRIMRNDGTDSTPRLHVVEERCNHDSGEALPATVEREREEARFGRDVQARLWEGGGDNKRVILVAPPHMLGLLRQDRPRHAHPISEIGKDWTKLPPDEIAELLQQHR